MWLTVIPLTVKYLTLKDACVLSTACRALGPALASSSACLSAEATGIAIRRAVTGARDALAAVRSMDLDLRA